MKLDFIDLGKLSISKTNMRYSRQAPDVSDILPTVRARGILVPLIVRPNCGPDAFEIVAGARRFTAAKIVAAEAGASGMERGQLPCAILEDGDDAAALEASLIENVARRDPDEVTQWETYTRLVKEGRSIDEIAMTFGLPERGVKRILALGNLCPRIRDLYRKEAIDTATVRHLTMASKAQQRAWLALLDGDTWCPTGHQLKAWLFGGGAIKAEHALFDVESSGLALITDLFGEERYFAESDAFWTHQDAAILDRKTRYLDAGWSDVVILPRGDHFAAWDHRKAAKHKGGRVYVEVRRSGEVCFHEGFVTAKEAQRLERGETVDGPVKTPRPEVPGTLQTYIDLHRHAAVRAALTAHAGTALRLMTAHAIAGSPLWRVAPEPQTCRSDTVRESVEVSKGEAAFDAKRRAVLALLGVSPEEPTLVGGTGERGLVGVFLRLLDLPDVALMEVIAVVMGETLAAGSAAVEAVGVEIGIDMARYWQADDAFFETLRDKTVLGRLVAEIAGEGVAAANAAEPGKVLKAIIRDHLQGTNGRAEVSGWVPRWMRFPPAAYTARGGVGSVEKAALVAAARTDTDMPPEDGGAALMPCAEDRGGDPVRLAA
ncbi:ParB/RepB/Spo0J family partition protein [Sphingosinicella microcystinivorans]|uniref:Chromosome partitioning protein ParB n=1 Tax=Sphingosinicella microcystinivorans TaxID=335406 RepID=A0AAD1D912_SPHMI|nr:ParB/RepB/Spo0J family partition protein [Sphingosinicella microcystinivorans]RKS88330.1 ParB family chromosome partitioning protein [Sphingosinicella microcystinivorans]BBE36142.1 chromosome partitioning protein ParB [Sphingosinicella microcystinivorans]